MTASQRTKEPSDKSASAADRIENAHGAPEPRIATEAGSSSAAQESPRKRKAAGITMGQKQALIDNLQLEITERARKLRAQYNLQAQGLRTRIEIRVNRIPMALRKSKMGELADKHKNVPAKDTPGARPISQATSQTTTAPKRGPGRPPKRTSDQISGTGKENETEPAELEQPKKRTRKQAPPADSAKASRVLSPASSNTRTLPRTTPGGKPLLSRPGLATVAGPSSPTKSPSKQHSSSNLFSNLAEKARSTRTAAAGRKQAASTSTTASSTGGSARGRKPAATATISEATSKTARRVSGISESSESSTSTVVKKGAGKAAQTTTKEAAPAKRTVMGTIRRGVAGAASKKAAAAKSAKTPASTATGRVLRNRS
ncbi:hypothetical protein KVR01_005279 [Diaporthe batatas]|uniref:uncharacterized protein n=1 Tax=Diaporthe batatas TaxID=748121 RepID=UPI001D04DF41|nr:uncharacterized protein KVR01_005279 [Diaporthe batatas]KAG8165004.1 hypothetical protein KVR01_005279 [Diaporthe batatas]